MRPASAGILTSLLLTVPSILPAQSPSRPLLQAQPEKPYEVQLGVPVSGTPPFSFSLLSNALPPKLSLDRNGVVNGVPDLTSLGDYPFSVLVTDLYGKSVQADFLLRVSKSIAIITAASPAVAISAPTAAPRMIPLTASAPASTSRTVPDPTSGPEPDTKPMQTKPEAQKPVTHARVRGPLKEGDTTLKFAIDSPHDAFDLYVCALPAATTSGGSDCLLLPGSDVGLLQAVGASSSKSLVIAKDQASAELGPIIPLQCDNALTLVEVDVSTGKHQVSSPIASCSIRNPTLDTRLGTGISFLEGRATPSVLKKDHVDQYDQETRISVESCIVQSGGDPNADPTLCRSKYPQGVSNGPNDQDHYVVSDKDGFYSASLQAPIFCPKEASPSTRRYLAVGSLDVASGLHTSSQWIESCHKDTAKEINRCDREYNDCDEGFSLVGGIEQGGLSAQPSQTSPFIRAFTRSTPSRLNTSVWASIRLLGAPEASSTAT